MKIYKLNVNLSNQIHHEDNPKPNECYNNVFKSFINNRFINNLANTGDLTICYGYAKLYDDCQLCIRHAFFKYKDEIIDPTLLYDSKNKPYDYSQFEYYIFKEYDALNYLKDLLIYDKTCLMAALHELDLEMQMKLMKEKNIVCMG